MTHTNLLPCPFCGEHCMALVIDQGDKWAHYEPGCTEVRTGYDLSDDAEWRAEAITAWNTRARTPDTAPSTDLIAEAEAQITRGITLWQAGDAVSWMPLYKQTAEVLTGFITALRAAEAENARLREALDDLLPPVLCGESWNLPDDEGVEIRTTFGAIFRARRALGGSND